jgi:hypothetical protein
MAGHHIDRNEWSWRGCAGASGRRGSCRAVRSVRLCPGSMRIRCGLWYLCAGCSSDRAKVCSSAVNADHSNAPPRYCRDRRVGHAEQSGATVAALCRLHRCLCLRPLALIHDVDPLRYADCAGRPAWSFPTSDQACAVVTHHQGRAVGHDRVWLIQVKAQCSVRAQSHTMTLTGHSRLWPACGVTSSVEGKSGSWTRTASRELSSRPRAT